MKKLLCLILIILSVFITSCKKQDINDEVNHYDFLSKEEIENLLTTYHVDIELLNTSGVLFKYSFWENNDYFYYTYSDNKYFVEKATNKIYSINEGVETRYLEQQIEFKYDEIKTIVVDFLSSHLEINDSNYALSEEFDNVADYECEVYSLNKRIDANNYTIDTLYVGKENGLCYKNFVETCSLGKKITSYWEVKELSFDEVSISNEFARFLAFKEEVAPLEFDKWPDMGLGTLVPEYKDGKFVLAMDEGDYALIAYDNTTLIAVKNYTSSLKTYGFEAGVSKTNEANQYTYLTYNKDNIMVIVTFTPINYTLAIKIYQSTQEDINKELAKFK